MTEKFFHWLIGYTEFQIYGNYPRFLNIAAKSGFTLWGFSKNGEIAAVRCRARNYKRLRPIAHRCDVRLKHTEKRGLPFLVSRIAKRKGMLVGAACGVAVYAFLNSFVWGITVTGTETLTDRAVLESARKNGVCVGAAKSDFTPRLSARGIISDLPELKWASVNTDGCFIEIAVSESAQKPEIADDTQWSNMVASRAGRILEIEAEHGRPEVSLGDTVQAGDLLISGLYQEYLDPYSPIPDDPYQSLGSARGRVIAETYREFTVQISAKKVCRKPTGKRQINRVLNIFGLRFPLGFNTVPQEEFTCYTKTFELAALGTQLPLSVESTVYDFTEEETLLLTETELKESALLKLRETQKSVLPSGGTVTDETLSYAFPDGMCILTAKCRCKEEIGILQKVLVNPTETE